MVELTHIMEESFIVAVKANVDIVKKIMVIDGEMHSDIKAFMIDNGSNQEDIWGINLLPDNYGTADFIVFDSMINTRPRQGNPSRNVEDVNIREKITQIVESIVIDDR
jgi:hypothetical protein